MTWRDQRQILTLFSVIALVCSVGLIPIAVLQPTTSHWIAFGIGVGAAVVLGVLRRRTIAAEASGRAEPATLAVFRTHAVDQERAFGGSRRRNSVEGLAIVAASVTGAIRPEALGDWERSALCGALAAAVVVTTLAWATFAAPREKWLGAALSWFGVGAAVVLLTRGW